MLLTDCILKKTPELCLYLQSPLQNSKLMEQKMPTENTHREECSLKRKCVFQRSQVATIVKHITNDASVMKGIPAA